MNPDNFTQIWPPPERFSAGICAFLQKCVFERFQADFSQKKGLHSVPKRGMLYPTKRVGYNIRFLPRRPLPLPSGRTRFTPAGRWPPAAAQLLFAAAGAPPFSLPSPSFTFLAFTLPARPGQAKRRPNLHRAAALLFMAPMHPLHRGHFCNIFSNYSERLTSLKAWRTSPEK